jgi:hypothetical protein
VRWKRRNVRGEAVPCGWRLRVMSTVRVCGREFREDEIAEIRGFVIENPSATRRQISRWTCERLQWISPGGRLKEMSCRVALLRLEAMGKVKLPPPLKRGGNRKAYTTEATIPVPPGPLRVALGDLKGLKLRLVEGRKDSRLWNEAIHRFHYLGFGRLPGAQLRYLLEGPSGLLGALGFGASAWKVAPRDRWIGWSDSLRKERLHLIVNNARFLIMPWVQCKNLASWTLAECIRRLASDWQGRYGYRPVLLETFVERDRFAGTCYRAANWVFVGETQGRGKLDRHCRKELPVKLVWVYPLRKDFRSVLCA